MKNSNETKHSGQTCGLPILAALVVICNCLPAGASDAPSGQRGLSPGQQKRMEAMKTKGPDASLTILPVWLAGRPFDRVTEVVGLLLEQQGLKNIELGKAVFKPADKAGLETMARAVGEFVRKNPVATEYSLYAEFNGNPQTGLNELRAIVVDKTGAVVWTDRQTPEDAAFKKLGSPEPMSLSVLLVERLGPQLGLNEETAKAAKPGKMARLMDERSGLPPQDERSPLEERQKEMKVLWDLAREFRDHARDNPPEADYVLYADYAFNPQNWEQGYVHFVVCDRKGEWVIVDMQNSHHPDYQSVKPTARADCDNLLVKRLADLLR